MSRTRVSPDCGLSWCAVVAGAGSRRVRHPDIHIGAAASLAATPPDQTRAALAELTRAHLLAEHTPGRYAFHDLLRSYASEQSHARDSHDAREEAVHRVLDHYLHTARSAAMLIEPHLDPITLPNPCRAS